MVCVSSKIYKLIVNMHVLQKNKGIIIECDYILVSTPAVRGKDLGSLRENSPLEERSVAKLVNMSPRAKWYLVFRVSALTKLHRRDNERDVKLATSYKRTLGCGHCDTLEGEADLAFFYGQQGQFRRGGADVPGILSLRLRRHWAGTPKGLFAESSSIQEHRHIEPSVGSL